LGGGGGGWKVGGTVMFVTRVAGAFAASAGNGALHVEDRVVYL
jgi:hypothetical protein